MRSNTSLRQVKNFISLAGPHAGIASIPFCGVSYPFYASVLFIDLHS